MAALISLGVEVQHAATRAAAAWRNSAASGRIVASANDVAYSSCSDLNSWQSMRTQCRANDNVCRPFYHVSKRCDSQQQRGDGIVGAYNIASAGRRGILRRPSSRQAMTSPVAGRRPVKYYVMAWQ